MTRYIHPQNAIDFEHLVIDTKKTAFEVCAQIRAFNFREYQMSKIDGKSIVKAQITKMPSQEKPGKIVWQDAWRGIMATIDYDVVIYWDVFDFVMKAAADGEKLKKVPNLESYVNQLGNRGWTPLIVAAYYGHYDVFMLLISNGADLKQKVWNENNLLMHIKKNHDKRIFLFIPVWNSNK